VGKNVAVFVDVANIFYAAKAAGVDIDYVTLLKASSAGRDLVRAYAYTGLDPDNDNQRNFHDFLRRSGYKVVSKDIRKYGDGKVKANLDIELVVDMMKTARNLDVAIVVSGDGDFAPAIRAVQEMGVRVEVVSFRGNTSSDLMDVADQFTDIIQIAKVEKGSSRSGRRVAGADDDLSMTEVPDKQSEGTGDRSRGRGRTRRTTTTTVAATPRGRARPAATPIEAGDAPVIVALPGEKLSRAAAPLAELELGDGGSADEAPAELDGAGTAEGGFDDAGSEEARRRRRRRGGRGRGRGRGVTEGGFAEPEEGAEPVAAASLDSDAADDIAADQADDAPAPARRAASAFGSVWDSQIGIPASRSAGPPVDDVEDLEEPAVPEYLLAERRQRDAGRGPARGGGRGRGGAYAAALDRERFGGGRGTSPSRFSEPPPRRQGSFGAPDRGPRRDGRGDPNRIERGERQDRGDRGERVPFRQGPPPAPRGSGDEPWSEVPPEIEAMLRAQLSSRPAPAPRRDEPVGSVETGSEGVAADAAATIEEQAAGPARRRASRSSGSTAAATGRGRGRRAGTTSDADAAPAGSTAEAEGGAEAPTPAPARRSTARRPRAAASAASDASTAVPGEEPGTSEAAPVKATTRRSTTTRARSRTSTRAATDAAGSAEVAAGDEAAAPKRRATRKKAEPAG
jgi:uncharacterized LabA/DUF88 family protein